MIAVKNLTKKYGKNIAVNNISFNIEKGKIYGFLGPNGAGKSTTVNMIAGCVDATSGHVEVCGYNTLTHSIEARSRIGYLPETPPLYTDMTPSEYLMFVAQAKGMDKISAKSQIRDVMDITNITNVKDRQIRNLSKGYRQRVGIAQAMLGSPEIIILDEPTVGLDPKQIIETRELIRSLGKIKTVILSSHILAEIASVCDHVIIIHHGRIVADDSLDKLEGRMDKTQKLLLSVRGDVKEIAQKLSAIESITEISQLQNDDSNIVDLELKILKGENTEEAIFYALSEIKSPIVKMVTHQATLEDIFLSLTDGNILEENTDTQINEETDNSDDILKEDAVYVPLFSTKADDEEDDEQ